MALPDSSPLSITPDAIETMISHCRHAKESTDSEACGFIFGSGSVGTYVVGIRNVHAKPRENFRMDESGIIEAMKMADERGDDLVAVYHSHPHSQARPSEADLSVPDTGPGSPVYAIVSLENNEHPVFRAWRYDLPYIGQPRATPVAVHVSADGQPYIANPPLVPWALSVGNKVALTYQRPGHTNRRTIICEITDAKGEAATPGKVTLSIKSAVGTDPKVMLVERVKAVRVLRESPGAGRVRSRSATYGRNLAAVADDGGGFSDIGKYSTYILAAFPTWLKVTEGEQ